MVDGDDGAAGAWSWKPWGLSITLTDDFLDALVPAPEPWWRKPLVRLRLVKPRMEPQREAIARMCGKGRDHVG